MKYLKYFSVLFLFFIFNTNINAQKKGKKESKWYYETTIELNNGSVLKGKLISMNDETVKIEILGGSIFVYPKSEVKNVETSEIKIYPSIRNYQYNREGWYYGILGNINIATEDGGGGLSALAGFQYNNHLAAGLGLSYNQISVNNGVQTIPIFLDVRGNVSDNPTSLFYSMGIGYSFVKANTEFDIIEAKGGLFMHPALGIRFDRPSGSSFLFDFGYQFQSVEITSQRWNGINIDDVQYRRLTLRFGWTF
ncbi:MAG: hypothetical protein ACPGXZ_12350 [Saprospiraceae bacterium]